MRGEKVTVRVRLVVEPKLAARTYPPPAKSTPTPAVAGKR